jgi:hypothetical protein
MIIAIGSLFKKKRIKENLAILILMLLIFSRFFYLGVASAALQLGPG